MSKTSLSIQGESFLINGQLTYAEIPDSNPSAHGLLMNARFIQGIFDDKADPGRFNRFDREFNADQHTNDLIAALPAWYDVGLRAFTVGIQGGGPCFTTNNRTIDNNPFGSDGTTLDLAYADRLDRLIRGADELGKAVCNAVKTASNFLRDGGYTNVIIEIANEQDVPPFKAHPLVYYPEGVAALSDLARTESDGIPVGCSGMGGSINREIVEASHVIFIHGNGCTRQQLYNMIREVRGWGLDRPILCNEDSQAVGQLEVTYQNYVSWSYYNNMTKQEPPADWGITRGEDEFFARRLAAGIGIEMDPLPLEDQYYLQGVEPEMTDHGQRWIRLASLYPESINFVEFFRNGELYYTSFDEPFPVHFKSNWLQGGVEIQLPDEVWTAVVHLRNGAVIER